MDEKKERTLTEKIVNLCLRRGILSPNSEIYGTFAGFYDFGPVGVELKRNVEASWWKTFVHMREDIVGIDGAIITHPAVWKASGHVDAFNDPLVVCTRCKKRFRADHLIEGALHINVDGMSLDHINEIVSSGKVVCPDCHGILAMEKPFNLMFKTHVGAVEDEASVAFLRPETAQLIFINFKAVQQFSRKKLPFGIAQIGKVFRNEISPRNFVFRCREFNQMEIEYFIHPAEMNDCPYLSEVSDDLLQLCTEKMQLEGKNEEIITMSVKQAVNEKIIGTTWHAYWIARFLRWFTEIGISSENLRVRQHIKDELSHYSSETWDIEYKYPWGWKELMGIANRGDFDLIQHAQHSGKDLSYFDQEKGERVVPYVIEPSAGLERLIFTILLDSYYEKSEKDEIKTVLKLNPTIAPVKVGVFPLMKKDGLKEKAREVYEMLNNYFVCEYDDAGSIGKRYARADEIGTPFAVTIDYQTLQDSTVTLRDRDSASQVRVHISELVETIRKALNLSSGGIS